MSSAFFTAITKLLEVDFALDRFLVFYAKIIDSFAGRASKFY